MSENQNKIDAVFEGGGVKGIGLVGAASEIEARGYEFIKTHNFVRTITINARGVNSTDFNLRPEQKAALYQSGVAAAQTFLQTWNFQEYIAQYRNGSPVPPRCEQKLG